VAGRPYDKRALNYCGGAVLRACCRRTAQRLHNETDTAVTGLLMSILGFLLIVGGQGPRELGDRDFDPHPLSHSAYSRWSGRGRAVPAGARRGRRHRRALGDCRLPLASSRPPRARAVVRWLWRHLAAAARRHVRVPPYLELGAFTPRARHGDTAYSGAYLCAFGISEGPCPVLS
jgi:hypothetical protein